MPGRIKVILFSHHQLFSAFLKIGGAYRNPSLLDNLREWQAAGNGNIVAWLWGHEHLLEVYADPVNSGLPIVGRCIGHGAFPVFVGPNVYTPQPDGAPVLSTSEPPHYVRTGDDGLIYNHGFAMLELGADSGKAIYYQVKIPADGSPPSSEALFNETFPVKPGQ